jgi:hypothetical protein
MRRHCLLLSPPLSCVLDPTLNLDLFTPRKRMRTMSAALSGTVSGSFLVSCDLISSVQRIAPPVIELNIPRTPPDYNLSKVNASKMSNTKLLQSFCDLQANLALSGRRNTAQQSVMEAQTAQLVVQHLHLNKLN